MARKGPPLPELEDLAVEVQCISALLTALGEPRTSVCSDGISWLADQLKRVSRGIDEIVEADLSGRRRHDA